jgi:hypothetical protein
MDHIGSSHPSVQLAHESFLELVLLLSGQTETNNMVAPSFISMALLILATLSSLCESFSPKLSFVAPAASNTALEASRRQILSTATAFLLVEAGFIQGAVADVDDLAMPTAEITKQSDEVSYLNRKRRLYRIHHLELDSFCSILQLISICTELPPMEQGKNILACS